MSNKQKKVLIAEDDLSLWPVWQNFFDKRPEKIDVHLTVSCEEALKMVAEANITNSSFDLIITDIFLAGSGTGMELLSSSEVEKSKAGKLLVSVADSRDILIKYGHMIPDTKVISKPFEYKRFEPVIAGLLK